jgi:Glycosyltransferase family 87
VIAERGRSTGDWAGRIWLVAGLLIAVYCIARALPVIHAWDVTPGIGVDPFTDSITYLAAGERLNAGHDLYRLGPGDRPVLIVSDTFTAPLVSPPVIAVLWRPLAALPVGQAIWIAACWVALLSTVVYVVAKARWIGIALTLVLMTPIAEQLAVANAAAFFPALLILSWRLGDSPVTGAALGLMAVIKLSPVSMLGWLVAIRARRALIAWVAAVLGLAVIGAIGAGVGSYVTYLDVARTTNPSEWSLSALTGQPWMTYAVLVGGTVLAALTGRRPAASFMLAVVASVFGSPALYPPAMVPLLALAAPFFGVTADARGVAGWLRANARVLAPVAPT